MLEGKRRDLRRKEDGREERERERERGNDYHSTFLLTLVLNSTKKVLMN